MRPVVGDAELRYLTRLGFNQAEIEIVNYIIAEGRSVTPGYARKVAEYFFGAFLNSEDTKRISYLSKIQEGLVDIDTMEGKSKHYRKMSRGRKIGASDLYLENYKRVRKVERFAVVAGLGDPYSVINSLRNGKIQRYKVLKLKGKTLDLRIKSNRRPTIKYQGGNRKLGIENEIEITDRGIGQESFTINIIKDKVRLCNRYVIIVSLRKPEDHIGMISIVAYEGSLVYVYAKEYGYTKSIDNSTKQRIYLYGIQKANIKRDILKVAKGIKQRVGCLEEEFEEGNSEYIEIRSGWGDKPETDLEEDIEL